MKQLHFPEVKVIRSKKFSDARGYFTELYKVSDFKEKNNLGSLKDAIFVQINESFSQENVIRGLHFQWNPYIGKLIRTVEGHMLDLILDIRKNSPTFGKIIAYDMPSHPQTSYVEWIWVPVGFAHGNCFLETTRIEYLCTSVWNPKTEAGINPQASDIDWSMCDAHLRKIFFDISKANIMSDKDSRGFTLSDWKNNPNSDFFIYR